MFIAIIEQGAGPLLLNFCAPRGFRGEGSYILEWRLRDVWAAHVQVPGWSVDLMTLF